MSKVSIILPLLGLGIAGYLVYMYYSGKQPSPPSPPEEASYSTHFNKWVEIK